MSKGQVIATLPRPLVWRINALAHYKRMAKKKLILEAAQDYLDSRSQDGEWKPLDTRKLPTKGEHEAVAVTFRLRRPDERDTAADMHGLADKDGLFVSTEYHIALERYIAKVGGRTMAEAERVYQGKEAAP